VQWCAYEFALSRRQEDGSTLRDTLSAAERVGARRHPWMVASDDVPTGLLYLFEIFAELNSMRRMGIAAAEPIGFDQMYHWQMVSGFRLRGWERKALERLDNLWRQSQLKDYKGPQPEADDGD
jgi:hypothetical protein